MNKTEAISKILQSLKKEEARIIPPKGMKYEEFVEKLSKSLMSSVIDPIKVKVTSTCAKDGDFQKYNNSVVWGIARNGDDWLLTLENENEFALGFGDNPNKIKMHGFSSADVLGEWWA